MSEPSIKVISQGQVRNIYEEVAKNFTLVNMGTYIVITDNATNESTSYTYDSNFVYLSFCQLVRANYLNIIMDNCNYFNWRYVGFELAGQRIKYLDKIIDKVVELSCGWKRKQ